RDGGFVREWEEGHTRGGKVIPKHVPWNATDTIAEEAFNRYYMRALCRRGLEDGIGRLEVYRAKEVAKPRAEAESRVGTFVEPRRILEDLRVHPGDRPDLGIPLGPNRDFLSGSRALSPLCRASAARLSLNRSSRRLRRRRRRPLDPAISNRT